MEHALNIAGGRFVLPELSLGSAPRSIDHNDYGDLSPVNSLVATTFHDATTPFTLGQAEVRRGNDYLREQATNRIDVLKIDVEGAQMHVLRGFEDALRHRAIRVIHFGYEHTNADAGPAT